MIGMVLSGRQLSVVSCQFSVVVSLFVNRRVPVEIRRYPSASRACRWRLSDGRNGFSWLRETFVRVGG